MGEWRSGGALPERKRAPASRQREGGGQICIVKRLRRTSQVRIISRGSVSSGQVSSVQFSFVSRLPPPSANCSHAPTVCVRRGERLVVVARPLPAGSLRQTIGRPGERASDHRRPNWRHCLCARRARQYCAPPLSSAQPPCALN